MLSEDPSEFDIRIKDIFFSKKDFNYIKTVATNIKFGGQNCLILKDQTLKIQGTTSKIICLLLRRILLLLVIRQPAQLYYTCFNFLE